MTGIGSRLAALSPEQRALLERRLRAGRGSDVAGGVAGGVTAAPGPGEIPRLPRDGRLFPLSFAQERMWFNHQLWDGAPVYSESLVVEIEGRLDAALLGRSLDAVARRHEAFRTQVRRSGDDLLQEVMPPRRTVLPRVDLRGLPAAARQAAEGRIVATVTGWRFDLEAGPLFRGLLVELQAERALFLFVCHHIVFDGWSVAILFRQLFLAYDAFSRGAPTDREPPAPAVGYADWSAWQRQSAGGPEWAEQLAFWQRELAGVPPYLDLPTDLAPATPSGLRTARGARHHFFLPLATVESLKAFCQSRGATPFMVLLAVFQTLLFRATGEREIVVGSPVTQRTRAELEGIVGLFVNTQALRAHLADERPFADLLAEVRRRVLAAYAHRDLPFETLVQSLDLPRDPGRPPLAQVMFGFQKTPAQPFAALGLATRLRSTGNGTAKVELSLDLKETDHDLRGELEYSAPLFFAATIARLAAGYQNLLAGVLAAGGGERPLGELPLLAAAEAHQVLAEWSRGRPVERRTGDSVAARIAAQVARVGPRAAVRDGELTLLYTELGRRAAALARQLRHHGVVPDRVVGLLAERTADWVVGAVAILLSGGAYLPLDPELPPERLRFLAADAGAAALVATPTAAGKLADAGLATVLLGAAVEPRGNGEPPVATPVDGDHLAYVLYTSGTTGRPNGVMVTQGNVLALLDGFDARVPVPDPLAGALVGPTSFDVSVWDLLTVLSHGGTLEICPVALVAEAPRLARYLVERGITQAYLPPALLPDIASELARHPPGAVKLRRLLVGVAPIEQATLARFLDLAPGLEIASAYGPTETTVAATLENFRAAAEPRRRATVGGPIDGYEAFLFDSSLRPLGIGWTGEFCLGGGALARGYRGRPELTAERFVPHPAPQTPGERLYRTGDLGRFLPDGRLEFLRRRDTQVKVRGFRVEPGEIESVLAGAPGVRETVVVVRQDELVAYVVASPAAATDWREHLRARLPAFMVPSHFVLLDALPRTERGKLDRHRLPAPSPENAPPVAAGAAGAGGAPRDELEATLARLMAAALGAPEVRIEDDFFTLGGYSLLASRLVQRIRETLAVDLPLATFFTTPTVAGVAAWVRGEKSGGPPRPAALPACLVPIQPGGTRPPLFCVHPASGSPLCYVGLSRALGPDLPVWGLQSPGLTDAEPLLPTVEAMAEAYVSALRRVQPRGPYHLAGWSFGAVVAFEMAAVLGREGEAVAFLGLFDAAVSDRDRQPERRAVRDALVALRGALGNGFRLGLPRSYGELRELASWVGLSLPESWAALRGGPGGRRGGRRAFLAELGRGLAASGRIFKLNFFAERTYVPAPIPGAATLFRTRRLFTLDRREDPTVEALRPFVRGELEVVAVPGNHMTMLGEPHVGALAREIAPRMGIPPKLSQEENA